MNTLTRSGSPTASTRGKWPTRAPLYSEWNQESPSFSCSGRQVDHSDDDEDTYVYNGESPCTVESFRFPHTRDQARRVPVFISPQRDRSTCFERNAAQTVPVVGQDTSLLWAPKEKKVAFPPEDQVSSMDAAMLAAKTAILNLQEERRKVVEDNKMSTVTIAAMEKDNEAQTSLISELEMNERMLAKELKKNRALLAKKEKLEQEKEENLQRMQRLLKKMRENEDQKKQAAERPALKIFGERLSLSERPAER
ncbi:hypothetical protein EMPS_04247 [Entomortierella parvispora]|uniref:Uncharacterized protein n=1 Tax=Entomortierella parvispora TaxID=205924 RepID=A0A9P3LVM2_9FUNG|nr:hypothetical protein EMPS_04247 [Entomortierella parvispora]